MSEAALNEQWLRNGDCRICRRRKYCSNLCTKNKHLRKIALNEAIEEWHTSQRKKNKKELRKKKIEKLMFWRKKNGQQ